MDFSTLRVINRDWQGNIGVGADTTSWGKFSGLNLNQFHVTLGARRKFGLGPYATKLDLRIQGFHHDPDSPYNWLIVSSFTGVTNFSLTSFDLTISSNLLSAGGEGIWELAIGSSGTDFGSDLVLEENVLLLTFTPVPEPSTFALFAIGLAIVGMRFGRRRRV